MRTQRLQRWLLLIAGAWLLCSPLLIPSYDVVERVAIWGSHAAGVVLLILASISLVRPRPWLDWTALAVAGWLIVAPLVLGFTSIPGVATSNHMLVGIFVGLIALAQIAVHRDDAKAGRVEQH